MTGASATIDGRSGAAEWRESYPLVMTSFFGMAVSVMTLFSFGLFIEPIQRETGWGRGEISAALIVNSCIAFCAAPFAGRLIDRFGTRRVGIPGIVIYCGGVALLSLTGSQLWQWWAPWLVIASGYVLIKPTLWATAVTKRFDVHRGVALAVAMCGSGFLQVALPSVVGRLIADHGWRTTYAILALGSIAITLPLMLAFLRDRPPRADARAVAAQPVLDDAGLPGELRRSLLSSRFIRLALGSFIVTVATLGLQVHFVPMIVGGGLDRATAAAIAGVVGAGAIVGRLTCGYLLDRWRGQIVGAVFFVVPTISSVLLMNYDGSLATGIVIAAMLGLAIGSELDVIAFLISRYFGLRNYGTLVGTITGGLVLAGGLGPTLAGSVYDLTASYRLFAAMTIPMFLIGAVMVASLGDYAARPRPA